MPTIAEVRQKFPQYNDLSDDQLAGALHKKYYSDMPVEQFQEKIGMKPSPPPIPGSENLDPAQIPPRNPPMSFGEGAAGVAGNMLNAIPIVGPALVGAGNRISAAKHSLMDGTPYAQGLEEAQTKFEDFNRQYPAIANSAAAAGGIGSMLVGGGTGAGAKALGITGRNLATRTLAGGTTGAVLGGGDAYVRGKDPVLGAEIGGTFGAIAPAAGQAAGAGVRSMMRAPSRSASPALDELRDTADNAFQIVDKSGVTVIPKKVDKTINDVLSVVTRQKINPTLHPDSYAALQEIIALRGQTPTISELHQLRQIIGDAASSPKPADRRMASLMMDSLDNNIDTLNAFDVRGQGIADPKAAVTALRDGIETWRRMRKGETIARIFSNAEIDAGAKYTQAGMETAIRNGFKQLAKNQKAMRGFSPEETAAIRKVATGGPMENTLRLFGKFAPRGVVSAIPVMAASSYDLGSGAALALGAEASKRGATAMTMRNAQIADEMVRRGGPATRLPLPASASAAKRAVQAITLGGPMSLYPPLFEDSSARVPR